MNQRLGLTDLPVLSPEPLETERFTDAAKAVVKLQALYTQATQFLRANFDAVMEGQAPAGRYRAFYPQVCITTTAHAKLDTRLAFGHVAEPGKFAINVTRPDLFEGYLEQQLSLLIENHGVPVEVSVSDTPIPVHFAMREGAHIEGAIEDRLERPMRDVFDVPDLECTNDAIANGIAGIDSQGARPLGPFTAQRVDFSLARL